MTKVPKYVAASKEEFYDSLKVHIYTVVNRYKDVVYCWDVVNEAMSDANNLDASYEDSFRKSQAYQLCGDEFIKNAFIWAHEADPNAGLFYNDYSAWTPAKRTYIYNMVKKLQSEGAPITGIGMQGHYNIFDNPTLEDFEKAINMYLELVDDIQITEFDIRINEEAGGGLQFSRGEGQQYTEEIQQQQEQKYKDLFASPYQAANRGYIDDVIEPRNTRVRIINAFEKLQTKRLTNPLKKHSNIPL